MKKRSLLFALAVWVVACVLAPSAALAKQSKITPHIRGVKSEYTITSTSPAVTISGRLVYRKVVVRSGRRIKVDAAIPGSINLYRQDDNTGRFVWYAASRLTDGAFSFATTRGGFYMVRFIGTRKINSAQAYSLVTADLVRVTDLHAVSVSIEPTSGDLFVKLAADIEGPSSVLSSATPGYAIFGVMDQMSQGPGPLGSLGGLSAALQNIYRPGIYQVGFTVPIAQKDDELTIVCSSFGTTRWINPSSETATFTPSDLLP